MFLQYCLTKQLVSYSWWQWTIEHLIWLVFIHDISEKKYLKAVINYFHLSPLLYLFSLTLGVYNSSAPATDASIQWITVQHLLSGLESHESGRYQLSVIKILWRKYNTYLDIPIVVHANIFQPMDYLKIFWC